MNFFDRIWKGILALFGKKSLDRSAEQENTKYRDEFENVKRISFTAIMATAMANKATSDSTINVIDAAGNDTRRSEWIQDGLSIIWDKIAKETAQALGKGGKVFVPYVMDGVACVDSIDQSRMRITAMKGDEIIGVTLMADAVWIGNHQYFRWVDYELSGSTHIIRNRATNDNGGEVPLDTVEQWAEITPEIVIQNVEHLLIAYLKSPTDNRTDDQKYGVPITYGSDDIIAELHTCLNDMAQEYRLKKAFVGADERLFGKDGQMPSNGLFKKFQGISLDGKSFWEVFDPAIRDSSYLARFEQLCGLLESSVGVSPGILTKQVTEAATATEIKSANAATFAYINTIRKSVEVALNQLAYAIDILAEYSGATPAGAVGDWQIVFDWDMSMTESSSETFNQMSELESRGLLLPERLVSWVTGMDIATAKDEVQEAQKRQEKPIDSLLTEE